MSFLTAGRNSFPGERLPKPRKYVPDPRHDEFIHHIWALWLEWATGNYFPFIYWRDIKTLKGCSRGKPSFRSSALFSSTNHFFPFAGVPRPWKSKTQMEDQSGSISTDMYLPSRSKWMFFEIWAEGEGPKPGSLRLVHSMKLWESAKWILWQCYYFCRNKEKHIRLL